ncbi:hypothetical protein [Agarilytica rhodophyticola]|uniref:hypothetical protein n=1 Tax=Agarilytica rhodophyticola TaxID=1737490 RepID=UPI000B348A1F|nr:hypothetical protein [Agarilytica rhodophyticola]
MSRKIKLTTTACLVIAFLLYFLSSLNAEAQEKPFAQPYIELGTTVIHSENSVGGAGLKFNDRWDVHIGLMGEGETRQHGYQEQKFFYSFSRVVNPGWRFLGGEIKTRIGVAYTPDFQLVGERNYRLGLIFHYEIFDIEYFHYSSAGINDVNRGVDGFLVRAWLH